LNVILEKTEVIRKFTGTWTHLLPDEVLEYLFGWLALRRLWVGNGEPHRLSCDANAKMNQSPYSVEQEALSMNNVPSKDSCVGKWLGESQPVLLMVSLHFFLIASPHPALKRARYGSLAG